MVSATDLERLAGVSRAGPSSGADGLQRIQALERRFNDLLGGLERLVAAARGPGKGKRGPRARSVRS